MTWKKYSTVAVIALALVGCSNTNGTHEGALNRDGNPVEQTRYYNNAGEGMTNVRNYTNDGYNNRNNVNDDYYRNINNRTGENINHNTNHNETRYHVAKEAADKIVKDVKEIDRAYVFTSDRTAYVAAGLKNTNINKNVNNNINNDRNHRNDGAELTDDVKHEISKIVKSVDKNIDNVYVSTDPDFFDLTNRYAEDVRNGHPVEGFFDQFGNMVERLFPQNKR
ncbi:hypothetical protein CWR48_11265 [Oceanobacillus arenosus]|uniref:YhcN/YlaJ family sporulation lipoprotein n=1 Tax=Oceanobacillus arenosus TaxID=1229153 RepID=A0A3D8PPV1_9BACI|nr:YhcN/YlaJ family sporulation lipoprotein [Oceanobacillus arenosus]RDW18160.1 hypothetical protein CWR48_11265 [Oceanobacillus arenosus]